jgi:hypothetical protein
VEVDGVGDAEAEWKPDLAGVPVEFKPLPSDPFPVGCAVALELVLYVFAQTDDAPRRSEDDKFPGVPRDLRPGVERQHALDELPPRPETRP